MNDQIKQMVSPNIQTVYLIIEIKSNYTDRSIGEKTNPIRKCSRSFCNTAVEHVGIVKMKRAIEGMMPKTRLGDQQVKKLRIFVGPKHSMHAQNPTPVNI